MRNRPPRPRLFDRRLEFVTEAGPLLGPDHQTQDVAAVEKADRGDEIEPAFPSCQSSRQHHDRHSVGQPPLPRERRHARAADLPRIEDVEIDAARDRPQPVGADAVDLSGVLGDEIARSR